jgi:hypothetical protein
MDSWSAHLLLGLQLGNGCFEFFLGELDGLTIFVVDGFAGVFAIQLPLVLVDELAENWFWNFVDWLFFLVFLSVLMLFTWVFALLVLHLLSHHFIFFDFHLTVIGIAVLFIVRARHAILILVFLVVLFDGDFLSLVDSDVLIVVVIALFVFLVLFLDHLALDLVHVVLVLLVVHATSFFNLALAAFVACLARREVRRRQIQTVKVLGTHKQLALLRTQVLVRVHARLLQDVHVALQFLNLLQVVHESFADLLKKERSIRNIEWNALLDAVKLFVKHSHLVFSTSLSFVTLLLERCSVAHKGRTQVNALLKAVLAHESLHLCIEFALLFTFSAFHSLAALLNDCLMLNRGRGLLSDLITSGIVRTLAALGGQSGVDHLVHCVHVREQLGLGTGRVKLERLWGSWLLGLLELLHLPDKVALDAAEVRHWARSGETETEEAFFGRLREVRVHFLVKLALLFVFDCLHAWRHLRLLVALLSISNDTLLSLVLVPLHHHLEAGN